jgi:serine/threonine protein phosphatase PrpC
MLTYHSISKQGSREINEDSGFCAGDGDRFCFAVADGLGGHARGEYASRKFAEVVGREFGAGAEVGAREFLAKAFDAAQEEILEMQREHRAKREMMTTGVALVITGGKCAWAHCGDSRLYAFQKNAMRTRTMDHSVPQMLALSGAIKEKQIAGHPDRNRLLRVFGVEWDSQRYDVSEEYDATEYQAFLLCTDGFWEFIKTKTMERALKKTSGAGRWLEAMTAEVEKNGAGAEMDNYTAIAVRMEGKRPR